MKKRVSGLIILTFAALSACQSSPMQTPLLTRQATAPVQSMSAAPISAQYSYREPQGSITFSFTYGASRSEGIEFFKEFMRKYVDKNDIFNYQTVEKRCGSNYCVTFNIFGGQKDFINETLLPDAGNYVRQRIDVYNTIIN